MPANNSEVARLTQQIEAEYASAWQGMHGYAEGTARHDFISAKMERVEETRLALVAQVGEEAAMAIVVNATAGKVS